MSDEFEVERTLCQLPCVHVIRIPARKSADGHRAADWPTDPIWTGRLKITAKGKLATITLMNDKNEIFGQCPVTDDAAVERTLDSGRYFVLRVQNAAGKHAFIGIAFNERNDAFEFNVSLQEFRAEQQRESQPIVAASSNLRDLSLKDGEKIKINITRKKKDGDDASSSSSRSSGGGTTGSLLAPPPGSKPGLLAPPKGMKLPPPGAPASKPAGTAAAPDSSSSSASTGGFDDWGFGSTPAAAPVASKGASAAADNFFDTSDPFAAPPTNVFGGATSAAASTAAGGSTSTKPASAGGSVNLLDL